MQTDIREEHFFTTALDITVILKPVPEEAERISLEAMNAKSIVARAGDAARTIQPIANEADELARNIIALVGKIQANAIDITRSSLTEFTEEIAMQHFARARALGGKAQFVTSVDPVVLAANVRFHELHKDVADHVRTLSRILGEIETILLAATIIISKFRLEVAIGGAAYRQNFETLVAKFEDAVNTIRGRTSDSRKILERSRRKIEG